MKVRRVAYAGTLDEPVSPVTSNADGAEMML